MQRSKARKNSYFYPNAVQASWGALASRIVSRASAGKLTLAFFESFGECEYFYSRLKYFLELGDREFRVKILPPLLNSSGDAAAFDALCERAGTLNAMAESAKFTLPTVVLTTPESFFDASPAPQSSARFELRVGEKYDFNALQKKLMDFGYYNEVLCESPGQFAARGGIIDIYPVAATAPVRLDFFGELLESARLFNPDTQLSENSIKSVRIDSVPQGESSSSSATAFDYLPSCAIDWIFFEPDRLASKYSELFSHSEDGTFPKKSFANAFARNEDFFFGVSPFELQGEVFENAKILQFESADLSPYTCADVDSFIGSARFVAENEGRAKFIRTLADFSKKGLDIFIASDGEADEELAKSMFKSAGAKFKAKFIKSGFGDGFIITSFTEDRPDWKILSPSAKGAVFVGSRDIFGRGAKTELEPRRRMFSHRAQVDQLLDFSELGEGDYVVHLSQGVCRYHGIVEMDMNGSPQELIKLEFEDEAMLYLPLHKAHLLSRYIGLDKRQPKLARLNSKAWTKVKVAAEHAALDYAAELLEMQSRRDTADGIAFAPDDDWQRSFDATFPYRETPDQLRAIDEVKADMISPRPMDRLLCADVGFGKTEVAMRAAFKCALSGKQAALLCPTTILCQQHFRNFRERMSAYPVVIEMLSRFRTKAEIAKIKSELVAGKIDIIIATHALLASDVEFKNLGLLVIDEEHRFGVRHKEKIKSMREGVDVLSMSATPIPRTLYFAMMGARSMSIMETPPKNRFPVETYVREYSEETVKSAIEREVARGGQVFYLHNRVGTIEDTARKLSEMFPNLRVGVGHGRMSENALERLMANFVDGKFDILVCTTIIESGLDIPNCNTIIIEGADKFGLAQLYQLRGRVGRFTRRAYAWLLLHRHASIVDSARKRLGAIRQYNKPGAGFRIATRDLQLRGCGNLLGARQSGHIAGVGFDLYCALLKRSVALLKGEKCPSVSRASLTLDFIRLGEGDKFDSSLSNAENYFQEILMREIKNSGSEVAKAYIPRSYIPQTQLRIDVYRRISMSASLEELEKLKTEIRDRFGKIPESVEMLLLVARVRICAEAMGFDSLETSGEILKLGKIRMGKTELFKMNGHFPRLTNSKAVAKLTEIENFLRNIFSGLSK